MITGTLMFDAEVKCINKEALNELSREICRSVKSLNGVSDCQKVDSQLNGELDDDESEG